MKIVGFIRNLVGTGFATRTRGLHRGLLAVVAMLAVAAPVQAAEPNSTDTEVAKAIANSVCAACHGEDGNSTAPQFPRLAGLAREYLAKQMTEFISGKRKNDMMATAIADLRPEDITSLSHYYNKLRFKPDPSEDGKLNEEGELLFVLGNETTGVPACTGCHGQNGEGIATVPRLTGQNSEYLLLQLKNFNIGIRTNDPNRFMQSIAQRMTEQEMKAVARYVSGLEFKPKF
ncbi:MAG TPA: c-type cytochrome [Gallionella sp.]|nr:c-type cytochrome [Gallionella sp.]